MVLEPIPTERLVECFKLAMTTRSDKAASFPVNAQEIFNAWKSLNKPEIKSSSEAWAIVRTEILRKGWNGTPEFDDPLVAKVVRQLGWNFLCVNETAATRFEWAWKEEAGIFRERVTIDPGFQLAEAEHRALIPEVAGMFNEYERKKSQDPDSKPTPEEVKAMFENARASVVSRKVN